MKKFVVLAVACAAALALSVPAGAAKKGFKTGTYTATGAVAFKFKIYKGSCYATGSKKKKGYCVSGVGSPPRVAVDCPDIEGGVKDHTATAFIPNQKYLPKSGKIRISARNPIRTDEWDDLTFNLKVKNNGRASGDLSVTSTVKSSTVQSTCPSGVLKFTAKR